MVVDLAVSAFKIPPMERPKRGRWLKRPDDFEVLIYWRQDRLVRRVIPDFADMVAWAKTHNVRLVSATQNLGDPTQHAELVLPFLKARLGEGESRSISDRMAGYYAWVRSEGRWGGGKPPHGYMSVKVAEPRVRQGCLW